jgi:hypothetical protein
VIEKKTDKRRLSLEEALIDAYLHVVEGMEENTYCSLPKKKYDLPLPRIFSKGKKDDKNVTIVVIPGSHLTWMFSRKTGFSWAQVYLEGLAAQLEPGFRMQMWDLTEEWAEDRLSKLEEATGLSMERFGPDRRSEVITGIKEALSPQMKTYGNWLLESWKLYQFDMSETA